MSQIEDRSPLCLDPQFHFQVSAKVPFHVRKQLERYQIFTSQFDDTGMLHPSFKVIGFYHALKMYGVISDFELFQIYLQIRTFCLSPEDIDIICRKFHIHIVLFLIDENGSHLVNVNGKNYCGVPRDETFYYIKMNIFKHHIFLEEITPFSTYYIKNIENEPIRWEKQDHSKGTITRNGLCFTFYIEEGHISHELTLSYYGTNDYRKFRLMADNQFFPKDNY